MTLFHVIKPGVDSPHLNTGCVAGDEESWEVIFLNENLIYVCDVFYALE